MPFGRHSRTLAHHGVLFLDELTEFETQRGGGPLDVCDLAAREAPSGGWLSTRRNRRIGESHRREGPNMPVIQGLSKAAANYQRADNPKFSCGECKFMFPRLAINPFATGAIFGGCRYVRGVIHADDTCDESKRRSS